MSKLARLIEILARYGETKLQPASPAPPQPKAQPEQKRQVRK